MKTQSRPGTGTIRRARNIPVLMYHSIASDEMPHRSEFVVTREIFRRQMEYLVRNGFSTPRLPDLLAGTTDETHAVRRPVVITFDDGYLDNVENALPVLQELALHAFFFFVPDWPQGKNRWDSDPPLAGTRLMESRHVLLLAKAGFECGSHSVSHRSLPCLSNRDLDEELKKSRTMIEELIQQPISALAYPYGDVDQRVKVAARNAGYTCAFGTNSGPLGLYSDIYEIRRVRVLNRADSAYLAAVTSGVLRTYMWVKWTAKRTMGMHNRYHDE